MKRNRIHFTHRLIIHIMRNRCFHDEFAHIVIVVVPGQQNIFSETFFMICREIQWRAKSNLKGAGQSAEHQIFDERNGVIELILSCQ